MGSKALVEFVFGLGSRYSYLAATQLGRLRERTGCELAWTPISSVELMAVLGRSPFEGVPVSGQYESDYRRTDAAAWADYYGVPFTEPRPMPQDHQLMAIACRAADRMGAMVPYIHCLFRAIFDEHREIDPAACVELAARQGIDRRAFGAALLDPEIRARISDDARRCAAKGVFGVPTFLVDDRMFWGNDRLVLLEHYLGKDR